MHIPDVYLISPLHTPAAILWNIKTLGLACWLHCLAQNFGLALAEHYTRARCAMSRDRGRYIRVHR